MPQPHPGKHGKTFHKYAIRIDVDETATKCFVCILIANNAARMSANRKPRVNSSEDMAR